VNRPSLRRVDEHPGSGLAAVVLATTAFSAGFVIVKAIPLEAGALSAWRLGIGGTVLAVAALLLRSPWPASWTMPVAAGAAFGVHQLLFVLATKQTSIAIVTLVGALQPLLVAMVSRRTLGERVGRAVLACAVLAVSGVAIVVGANLDDPSRTLEGDLFAGANLVAFTAYFLCAKRARDTGAPTLTLTATSMLVAFAVVLPYALLRGESFAATGAHGAMIVGLALIPGNGHLLLNWAHPRISAALSSLALAAVPLLASIWAALAFGEPYGPLHVVGMLLVAAAIDLGRRADRRARRLRSARDARPSPTPARTRG
jgi:drug/metabolite transporter (DMT)-like permease